MWQIRNEQSDRRSLHYAIDRDARPASYADVLGGWQSDATFRELFNSCLAAAPFTAFRWETPPLTTATLHRPFEFVLLDSPSLARKPEPEAFAQYFKASAS